MSKTNFVDGDPSQGILGTVVTADYLNKVSHQVPTGEDLDGSAPVLYGVDTGAADAYVVNFVFGKKRREGANTGTSANKLIDSGASFQTAGVTTGDVVLNVTDRTSATVTAVDSQTQLTLSADIFTATSKAYAVGPSIQQLPQTLMPGLTIACKATNANTGASTLDVNGLGTKTIKKNGSTDLVNGDIQAGQIIGVSYDGTYMQLLSPPAKTAALDANNRVVQTVNTIWDGTAGRSVSPTAAANTIPTSGSDGTLAAGWAGLLNMQVLSSGTTYTPTAGTHKIIVEIIGGGGGGGGAGTTASGEVSIGSGGGSGGYGRKLFTGINGTYNYSIGSGGLGVSGANGTWGGNTTFTGPGSVTITARGGPNGIFTPAATPPVMSYAPGQGAGGSTNCDISISGSTGLYGFALSTTYATGGQGAAGPWGSLGYPQYESADGCDGVSFGSGGGGALNFQSSGVTRAGGNGHQGVIIVWEFT